MKQFLPATFALVLLAGCAKSPEPAVEKQPEKPKSAYLVYVTNEGSGDMTVIDPDEPNAVATIPLGKRPRGIHASGGLIYVALSGSPAAPPGVDESTLPPPDKSADGIGVFDIAQGKVLKKLFGGSDPEQFALSMDGKTLYIANEDAAGLGIVDLAEGKLITNVATGEEPEGVTLSPDGKFVYVTSEDEGTVSVVNTATNKAVKKIKVGRRPRSVEFLPDGTKAFVTNENDANLTVIDPVKQVALRKLPVGEGLKPMGTAMTKDGKTLFVSTGRGKKVLMIDTATEKITAEIEAGQRPWGIALSPDEKLLFTANGPSNDVSVIDVATKTVVRKVKAGDKPWGVITVAR
jgi:YVTN family beta-propeller protein